MREFFSFMSGINWSFGKRSITSASARFAVGGGQFFAKVWIGDDGSWNFLSKPVAIKRAGKKVRRLLVNASPVEGNRVEMRQATFAAVKSCFEMVQIRPETFRRK